MRHLEIYENFDIENLLKDMQDLGIAPRLKGWWVELKFNSIIHQYIIWDEDIHSAMLTFVEEITKNIDLEDSGELETKEDFKLFANFVELSDYINTIFGIDLDAVIKAWEMIPTTRDIRNKKIKCIDSAGDLPKYQLNGIGSKEFSNFYEILKKYPEGNS